MTINEELKNMDTLCTIHLEPRCSEDNFLSEEADVAYIKKMYYAVKSELEMTDNISDRTFDKWMAAMAAVHKENRVHVVYSVYAMEFLRPKLMEKVYNRYLDRLLKHPLHAVIKPIYSAARKESTIKSLRQTLKKENYL